MDPTKKPSVGLLCILVVDYVAIDFLTNTDPNTTPSPPPSPFPTPLIWGHFFVIESLPRSS